MEEKEYLEELKSDPGQPRNQKRSVGLNGELLAGIWVCALSLVWLLFSIFITNKFYWSNLYVFGIGVLILILGFIKYQKVKNTDLDF